MKLKRNAALAAALAIITVIASLLLPGCGKTGASGSSKSSSSSAPSAISSAASSGAQTSSASVFSAPVSSPNGAAVPGQASPSGKDTGFSDPAADQMYVQAYMDYASDKYDAAEEICDKAIAADSRCFWAYTVKGIALYFANGNSHAQEALDLINRSLAINPNYSYAYFNEALIYKGLKQYGYSITSFDKDLQLKPDDQWAYFGIATVYADTDQYDLCMTYLKKSIDLDASVKTTARTESHFQKYKNDSRFQALVQ